MIQNLQILNQKVQNLEILNSSYYEWKEETNGFEKYLKDKVEENAKNRASNSSDNNGQQKVSKRGKGNKAPDKSANKK